MTLAGAASVALRGHGKAVMVRFVPAGRGELRLGEAVKARHGGLRRVRVWRGGLGTVGQVSAQ